MLIVLLLLHLLPSPVYSRVTGTYMLPLYIIVHLFDFLTLISLSAKILAFHHKASKHSTLNVMLLDNEMHNFCSL